jgi:hypothetical protein
LAFSQAYASRRPLDDVLDVDIGKDSAMRPERHDPWPRPQHQPIKGQVEAHPRPLAGQNPAEVAAHVIGRFEVDTAIFSERGVKVQIWVGADGFDPILEQLPDRLAAFEAREAKFVLADPPVLGWTVSHKERPSLPHFGGPQRKSAKAWRPLARPT